MPRSHRQSLDRERMNQLAPEHLLLLSIFGGQRTRHSVAAELNRRARLRPVPLRIVARSSRLAPAA